MYKIIAAVSMVDMEKFISEYIKNGWKCQGGICYSGNFYQAIIK